MTSKGWSLIRWLAVVLGTLTFVACTSTTETKPRPGARIVTDKPLAGRLDRVGAEALLSLRIAGMSVAVARDGRTVFAAGYGYSDLPGRTPAAANTVYQIGSISKQFTTAGVLKLVEEGRIKLDDPVAKYVRVRDVQPAPTVGQLLSHTAGITDSRLGQVLRKTSDGVGLKVQEVTDLVVETPYAYQAGSRHEYGNGGYLLAYRVIEAVTGERYSDFVNNKVLIPARLGQSSICPSRPPQGWADGYRRLEGNWARAARLGRPLPLVQAPQANMEIVNSVCATAPELLLWANALRTGAVVTSNHYHLMSTPTRLSDGTVVPYGMGLQLRRFGRHRAVAHGGVLGGFVSMLADFPDEHITVAVLVNTLISEGEAEQLVRRTLGAVFNEPPSQEWKPEETGIGVHKADHYDF